MSRLPANTVLPIRTRSEYGDCPHRPGAVQRTATVKFFANFPCYLAPDFTHYLSERLEMSSRRREIKEGQNKKRKLVYEKSKSTKQTHTAIRSLTDSWCSPVASRHPSWGQRHLRTCWPNQGSDCAAQPPQHWRTKWYAR